MSNQPRNQSTSQRPSASTGPAPMDTDPKSPPKAAPTYTDYRLVSAFDPNVKNNILKFAPSSKKVVNFDTFVGPVKLNRKDPWMIRKKAEEEKRKEQEIKLKGEIKDEDNVGMNELNSTNDTKEGITNKNGRDDTLIAPGSGSQPRVKATAFKKKTKQVFIAADQTARMLRKEEYQSWLLEDGAMTGSERWIGRYESAGAAAGSSENASSALTRASPNDAPNYVVFRLNEAGEYFQVLPCHRFYRFTQRPNYDTLGADEAEAAYEKMQKPTTKEDVGRWFMRRRGAAGPSGPSPASHPVKREGSVKPSILDDSKLSFGPQSTRPQVEVISHVNGRRGNFTAVHGANSRRNDEDEDEKPHLGQEGDFDEFDFNEDFADDEEGAGNLNDEAMEEDELKELEERMKKEMLAAGRAGDEERTRQDMDLDKEDDDKEDLTKEGKAVKKLLMRKTDNEFYESDDEVKNPYASEEDESDFEEVIPPPAPAVPSPTDSKTVPSSRAGTPGPSSNNPTSSQRNPSKLVPQKPTNLKIDKTQSRPPSRSGTPSLGTQSRAISPHPTVGTSNMAKPLSRANSPQPLSAGGKSTLSRTASPVQASTKPSTPTSGVGASSGLKRKHPGGVGGKEKRPNPGINSTPGSPLPDQGVGLMTEQEVINLLRNRPISTKELLSHFKLRLKEDRNKVMVFKIIKSVAQMSNGLLVLKDGL
ncbi:uncharacterized protein MELLADRAFT_78308 [Melampsora larici-populina 98AG31]|uniref:Transcription initiation factor IIF subunit alpha n=1 Tax=Melampsora larici-populina (strain 98AG31 / pathotype 3-4-7) TaxID=747676 RepID=F4RSU9_MELLP|nr:uncharacterized protein MELLADRAFT_78308 [Melampsora larici-populina 98AG31]EGG04395.1 hypothetical protein MELLADRAFT_78308 [Melampsora larici-populina 98AG31]